MTYEFLHPVRDASLGRTIPITSLLHAVGMQPSIGRIPNGMLMVVAYCFATERRIPTGCRIDMASFLPNAKNLKSTGYLISSLEEVAKDSNDADTR